METSIRWIMRIAIITFSALIVKLISDNIVGVGGIGAYIASNAFAVALNWIMIDATDEERKFFK